MDSTAPTETSMSAPAETPVKLTNAERLAALEESRVKSEIELAQTREMVDGQLQQIQVANIRLETLTNRVQGLDQMCESYAGIRGMVDAQRPQIEALSTRLEEVTVRVQGVEQIRESNASLREMTERQRQQIEELSGRLQGLDRIVKEQNAFMDELEKDMKEAFKNNGRTVAAWLEEKDRQFSVLQGAGSMEGRVAQLEELVRRLQYRVATR